MRVAVIGAGHWGTALALVAAKRGHAVRLWAYEQQVVASLLRTHENDLYLPGVKLPGDLLPTNSLEEALDGAQCVVSVMPSHVCRRVYKEMAPHLHPESIFVSATKGIEDGTQMRMSEVIRDVLRERFAPRLVVLSGPSFAIEVAREDPTAVVAASEDREAAELAQREFSAPYFRIYTNSDVAGVELGGAVKNVIAIAAGVVTGLGYGFNTAAAVVTRGLAEITRVAISQGGRVETMAGLAGIGDLLLTCTGGLSRNRKVGIELGKGRQIGEILAEMTEVAEGVKTTAAARELGRRAGVEMPITEAIYGLLYEGSDARETAVSLMGRPLREEYTVELGGNPGGRAGL